MKVEEKLHEPWLVAAWPGMGGVAITAGYYLMAKLGMHLLLEFPAAEFFESNQVEIKDGLVLTPRLPRSRLFLWNDPEQRRDLIVFIGEAQPPARGVDFCRRLVTEAKRLGVARVITFAAMATPMRPTDEARVFGAAIDRATLAEFRQLDMEILGSGQISGLNGVLLGVAAAAGFPGGCLLGEMPQIFPQVPFPKAAHAVLEFFAAMFGSGPDLEELQQHGKTVEQTLENFLLRMEQAVSNQEATNDSPDSPESPAPGIKSADRDHLDKLFEAAARDRSRAYELKQELDRLGVFSEYEDRFLDLFKNPD